MKIIIHFFAIIFVSVGLLIGADHNNPDSELIDQNIVLIRAVFFIPKGGAMPTESDKQKLKKHIEWAQKWFKEVLGGRDTFTISKEPIEIYFAKEKLEFYRIQEKNGGPWRTSELLKHFNYNRDNCPYVFVSIITNDKDNFPIPGGRNLNGGNNDGGGTTGMSLYSLRGIPSFQSTLRHELGHSFGLVHPDLYGYDMKTNESIMSYNRSHDTKDFKESDTPAILIPEDIRALALNKRVFPKLQFDVEKDVPKGYTIKKKVQKLLRLKLPEERSINGYHVYKLYQAADMYRKGHKKDAAKLAQELFTETSEITIKSKLNHLIYLCQSTKPKNLGEIKEDTVYLSEVDWTQASVGWGEPARDKRYYHKSSTFLSIKESVFLISGGQFYPRGLFAHSPSVLEFDLNKEWETFSSVIGLQATKSVHSLGVKFVVKGDGKVLYKSRTLKRPETEEISLDVSGISKLELIVENAGNNSKRCTSIWCEPLLRRNRGDQHKARHQQVDESNGTSSL